MALPVKKTLPSLHDFNLGPADSPQPGEISFKPEAKVNKVYAHTPKNESPTFYSIIQEANKFHAASSSIVSLGQVFDRSLKLNESR